MRLTLATLILAVSVIFGCGTKEQVSVGGASSGQKNAKIEVSQDETAEAAKLTTEPGHQLDMAIDGVGFFQILDEETGEIFYTRLGNMSIDKDGNLTIARRLLEPAISIPKGCENTIVITKEGEVSVKEPGKTDLTSVGQVELSVFDDTNGLEQVEEGVYKQTDPSAVPIATTAGNDAGIIVQGMLEVH